MNKDSVDNVEFYERINQKSPLDFLIGAYISLDKALNLKQSQVVRKQAFFNLIKNKFDWKFYTNYWLDLEDKISANKHHPQIIEEYREKANWIGSYIYNGNPPA